MSQNTSAGAGGAPIRPISPERERVLADPNFKKLAPSVQARVLAKLSEKEMSATSAPASDSEPEAQPAQPALFGAKKTSNANGSAGGWDTGGIGDLLDSLGLGPKAAARDDARVANTPYQTRMDAESKLYGPVTGTEAISSVLSALPEVGGIAGKLMNRAAVLRAAKGIPAPPLQGAMQSLESAMAAKTGQGLETKFGEMLREDNAIGLYGREAGNRMLALLTQLGKAIDPTGTRTPNVLDDSHLDGIINGLLKFTSYPVRAGVQIGRGAVGLVRSKLSR